MAPSLLFLMADYGHDPTETAIPWRTFKSAGFEITFATQSGSEAACDSKMLQGVTGSLLGASADAKKAYAALEQAEEFKNPTSWEAIDITDFDVVFLPGGHDKGIRPIIESETIASLLATFFPLTRRDGGKKKILAAICHGVQVLSSAKYPADGPNAGKSVMHDAQTTALPSFFESSIYCATKLWLGDYYKTFGAGSANVEDVVKSKLDDPSQFLASRSPRTPFIVEDKTYYYVSGRFPLDAEPLATKTIDLVKELFGAP